MNSRIHLFSTDSCINISIEIGERVYVRSAHRLSWVLLAVWFVTALPIATVVRIIKIDLNCHWHHKSPENEYITTATFVLCNEYDNRKYNIPVIWIHTYFSHRKNRWRHLFSFVSYSGRVARGVKCKQYQWPYNTETFPSLRLDWCCVGVHYAVL